jgi:cytochrome c-type biogenesis protein CcmH/NrfG
LYEQQSRLSNALTMANELVAVDPNSVSHRLKVGDLRQRLGRIPDAIAAYREATRLTPATAEAYTRLVALLLASPDLHDDTVGLAATAVSLSPSASSYLLLSAVLQKHNDIDGATAAVRNAIELEPDNPQLQNIYKQLTQSGS